MVKLSNLSYWPHRTPESEEEMDLKPTGHLSPTGFAEESEVSDQASGVLTLEPDQQLSEEQNYREIVRGVWLYMGI